MDEDKVQMVALLPSSTMILENQESITKQRSASIDSGNSSNSQSGSPILETSLNSHLIPEDLDDISTDNSTIIFEKIVSDKFKVPGSFTKNVKTRSTFNSSRTFQQTNYRTASSSSVEFEFDNYNVGTVKSVLVTKNTRQVKMYNTFAALAITTDQVNPGSSSKETDKLISDKDNFDDSDQPTPVSALKSNVREKLAKKNSLTEEDKATENITQVVNDRSLIFKLLIGSLLTVGLGSLWFVGVYYTMPFSSSSDAKYNFIRNPNPLIVASTPSMIPIRWILLVVDDCRASENMCMQIANDTTPADFRSFQVTAEKDIKEIFGFKMPAAKNNTQPNNQNVSWLNRVVYLRGHRLFEVIKQKYNKQNISIPRKSQTAKSLTKPTNNFLRISFKCDSQGLDAKQTEALFSFLDDHIDFGDVAQNYSITMGGRDILGCELNRSYLGIKERFAEHFFEGALD